jgi:hypothetical protein
VKKAGRSDKRFQLADICLRHGLWIWKPGKQSRCDHVDPLIRALRGKYRGHQELKGVFVIQHTVSIRIFGYEKARDLLCACRLLPRIFGSGGRPRVFFFPRTTHRSPPSINAAIIHGDSDFTPGPGKSRAEISRALYFRVRRAYI